MTVTDFQAVKENKKSRTAYDYNNSSQKSTLAYSQVIFFKEVCHIHVYLTNTEYLPRLPVQGSSGPDTRLLKQSHWAGISGTHQRQPLSFQSRTTKIYQNFTFNLL